MITADEAKTLYDQSGVEVDKYLQHKIEPEIKAAATSGNRTVFHFIGTRDILTRPPRPDPLQTRIIEKLRALGYTVRWINSDCESYVPLGLADDDDDDEGPSYTNYGIRITW